MKSEESWKTKTLVIGAIIGALSGLAAAYILVNQAEKENKTPELSAGQGVKLGLGVLGILRQISDL